MSARAQRIREILPVWRANDDHVTPLQSTQLSDVYVKIPSKSCEAPEDSMHESTEHLGRRSQRESTQSPSGRSFMDRTQKVLQAAARDAAARARLLAEALDALADATDCLPEVSRETTSVVHDGVASGSDQLWTVADVANFIAASESWVRHAAAAGRLPATRIGGLLRFQPDQIRSYTRGELPCGPGATVLPRTRRRSRPDTQPSRVRCGIDER
jgi:hypothetical protein